MDTRAWLLAGDSTAKVGSTAMHPAYRCIVVMQDWLAVPLVMLHVCNDRHTVFVRYVAGGTLERPMRSIRIVLCCLFVAGDVGVGRYRIEAMNGLVA